MHIVPNKSNLLSIQLLVLTALVVAVLFVWQGNIGLNLGDEGYLWYGVQRVMMGEVPIRDFMAYDPGRYYWSAALMGIWGNNGIMALRGTVAIFQTIGLFVGLWLIAQNLKKQNFLYLLLSAVTLVVWMYPRHKLFDISLSIFLVGILAFLIQNPSKRRYFIAGVCVGIVAVFGRNHGVYGVVGSVGVMVWLSLKRTDGLGFFIGFRIWTIGIIVGFMPILLMLLFVPGFAISFWDSIRFLFEIKATNLPLPIPWPWKVNFASLSIGDAIRGVLIGLFFIGTIIFGVLSLIFVVWRKLLNKHTPPVLVATSFLALPYAQYAYSRADVGHLALGIFPLLLGCLVFLSTKRSMIKWPFALVLSAASFWVMYVFHPGWQCHVSKQCVNVNISGSIILADPGSASDVALLRQLAAKYASDGQTFIATPYWPGAYALLERRSPMWDIYALFPRSQALQKTEIERIKAAKPGFAFIIDRPLDGRDELRFPNTHPLIYQYILDHFDRIEGPGSPAYQIFKAKGSKG